MKWLTNALPAALSGKPDNKPVKVSGQDNKICDAVLNFAAKSRNASQLIKFYSLRPHLSV